MNRRLSARAAVRAPRRATTGGWASRVGTGPADRDHPRRRAALALLRRRQRVPLAPAALRRRLPPSRRRRRCAGAPPDARPADPADGGGAGWLRLACGAWGVRLGAGRGRSAAPERAPCGAGARGRRSRGAVGRRGRCGVVGASLGAVVGPSRGLQRLVGDRRRR